MYLYLVVISSGFLLDFVKKIKFALYKLKLKPTDMLSTNFARQTTISSTKSNHMQLQTLV